MNHLCQVFLGHSTRRLLPPGLARAPASGRFASRTLALPGGQALTSFHPLAK
jgi:hypothetical protein